MSSPKTGSVNLVSTKDDLDNRIKANEKLIVLEFATEYSPYCQLIEPAINKFATETFTDVEFIKIDCNELDDVARDYRVTGYPTFILMKKKGRKVGKAEGADADKLKRLIERNR